MIDVYPTRQDGAACLPVKSPAPIGPVPGRPGLPAPTVVHLKVLELLDERGLSHADVARYFNAPEARVRQIEKDARVLVEFYSR